MKKLLSIVVIAAMAMLQPAFAQKQFFKNVSDQLKKNSHTEQSAPTTQTPAQQNPNQNTQAAQSTQAAPKPAASTQDGAAFYVSKTTGSNRADGSQSAPLKNLQKAIDKATDGAVIYVAEGNYYGTLDCGTIEIKKAVKIYGGYSTDFSERDILKHKTFIQPLPEANGTTKMGTIVVDIQQESDNEFVLDGFIIDRGNCNAYSSAGAGKPDGVFSPMLLPIAGRGIGGPNLDQPDVISSSTPTIRLNVKCPATIRNCAILNSFNYAILGSGGVKKITIENNLIINSCYAACEISGALVKGNTPIEFAHNTVLFNWARLKDLGDMGYGYRYKNMADSYVHHNIIGCSTFSGLDRTHTDGNKEREAKRITTAEHNIFFLNRQADLTLPGGGMFIRVWAKDFEDVEQLAEIEGNKSITDPSIFGGKLDAAYLKGFINVSYKENVEYDPNSGANQFRAALGMNKQGKINSTVTMYANRYPWEKAIELFGAVNGYGAQQPK